MKTVKQVLKQKNKYQTRDSSDGVYAKSFGKTPLNKDLYKPLHKNIYK